MKSALLLLLISLVISVVVAQIPSRYKTCDEVRRQYRDEQDPLGRFRPNEFDDVLFPDGPITYQAPLGAFSHAVTIPSGYQRIEIAGLVAKHESNSSLMGLKVIENGVQVDVTTLPPFNVVVKPITLQNGSISYVPVPSNATIVVDYAVQIRQSMKLLKRMLAGYGITTDYVSYVLITFRDAAVGRAFILSEIFSHFDADKRPASMTKESKLIDPNYACELVFTTYRPDECARQWYR